MAIQTTRWSPDSCGCVLEYQWDDTQSEDTRVHTPAQAVSKCAVHAALALAPHFLAVTTENTRKNRIFAAILANLPALTVTNADGQVVLKPGVSFSYVFDGTPGDRHVTVTVTGASAAQRNAMQTWADNNIGAGKVTVA